MVTDTYAVVRFRENFESDRLTANIAKQMEFKLYENDWLITAEKILN